jgi:integrase
MKVKITKRAVDSAKSGTREQFLWDTEIPGFGCKVTPKGARIFVLQYWARSRARRVRLGRYGSDLTVDQARAEARRLRGQIASGEDPAANRARLREIPMLVEFAERYLAEHAKVKKKKSSYTADERNLRKHILPVLGQIRLDALTRADIARFHASMREKPVLANRCLALLSKMFSLAEAWGLRSDGSNPTRHIEKYGERKIERFLSRDELGRLGKVLEEAAQGSEHSSAIAAIRLLIFSGCRRNEILTLKWAHVDFENGCLRLQDSKVGAKSVPLGTAALELLGDLPRIEGNPYVLPGKLPGKHFVGLERVWQRLRAKAELEDVRLHDLRHSFASVGAGLGESLVLIGALLGHRQASTTQRYAHLSDDPVRAAADRISGRLATALGGSANHTSSSEPEH